MNNEHTLVADDLVNEHTRALRGGMKDAWARDLDGMLTSKEVTEILAADFVIVRKRKTPFLLCWKYGKDEQYQDMLEGIGKIGAEIAVDA